MCSVVKHVCIYILLLTGIACAYAMPVYEQEWQAAPAIQNQHLMHTGVTYNGTIYTPFDNTVPSDYSAVGAGHGPKKAYNANGDWIPDSDDFGTGAEYGESSQSPVGEPWIMVFFALVFAGVTAWRQHKRLKIEIHDDGNHEK